MTREDAARLLPVIKAWAEGKTIEKKVVGGFHSGEWVSMDKFNSIKFDAPPESYRVKYKARRIWVCFCENCTIVQLTEPTPAERAVQTWVLMEEKI